MLTLTIWRVAILLESVILFRGFRGKLLSTYPFFYAYVVSVLTFDCVFYFVYIMSRAAYERWNLAATILNLIFGYGIILEIFRHVLSPYPGAERFARITWFGAFVAIFCFVVGYSFWAPGALGATSTVEIQRDFWTVQALFLIAIYGVVSYYRIPLGKNLKGMIFGYVLCLSVTLMTLALRTYIGQRFDSAWVFIQPFSYDVSLFIWATTLWAYHPNPVADRRIRVEADYDAFVERTRGAIDAMRSYLGKAARP